LTVDGVPESITHQQVRDWLAQLGFASEHLVSLIVGRGAITAELYALDNKGRMFVRDGQVARHQVVIRVGDPPTPGPKEEE
jgi:hypothetical protein